MKTLLAFVIFALTTLVYSTAYANLLDPYIQHYKKHKTLPASLMNESKETRSSLLASAASAYSNSDVAEACRDPFFKLAKQQDQRLEITEFVIELLKFDIEPDFEMSGRNGNKFSMLVIAAMQCDADMTALLLAAGADPDKQIPFNNKKSLGGMNMIVSGEHVNANWSALDVVEYYKKLLEEKRSMVTNSCQAFMSREHKTYWGLGKKRYTDRWEDVNPKAPYLKACQSTIAFLKGGIEKSKKHARYLRAIRALINSGRKN